MKDVLERSSVMYSLMVSTCSYVVIRINLFSVTISTALTYPLLFGHSLHFVLVRWGRIKPGPIFTFLGSARVAN